MGKLRVLFIGGTGVISAACVREAVASGEHDVYVLNRGQSAVRPLPDGVTELRGDARDPASVRAPGRSPPGARGRGPGGSPAA